MPTDDVSASRDGRNRPYTRVRRAITPEDDEATVEMILNDELFDTTTPGERVRIYRSLAANTTNPTKAEGYRAAIMNVAQRARYGAP